MDAPSNETVKGRLLNAIMYGIPARAHIRIAANVADEETVTIGADVYEFDRADDSTSSNILITAHADDTPAEATDALVAAINASGTEPVTAIDLGDNDILLLLDSANVSTKALAETMAGVGNVIDAAMYGGMAQGTGAVVGLAVVPTANEVAAGMICLPLDFVPSGALIHVRTTSSGANVAWDGKYTIDATNKLLKIDNAGTTDWSVDETLTVLVI